MKHRRVVVGLGITGLSVMRWLKSKNLDFAAYDTRDKSVLTDAVNREFSQVAFYFGEEQGNLLEQAEEIYLSPGIALNDPILKGVDTQQTAISGDLDIFMQHAKAPVVAITGSNAKSTVTTLVALMAEAAGLNVAVGGNLGTPMLELLNSEVDLYVLELSSFQLERSAALNTRVACILNISPDHLDHHGSMIKYLAAKQHVYRGADIVVYNRDDQQTYPLHTEAGVEQRSFGATAAEGAYYIDDTGSVPLLSCDNLAVLSLEEIKLAGKHNLLNIMAAMEIGAALGFAQQSMLEVARQFRGLPHRCEFVAELDGVRYINDSKATNVGAALAALKGVQAGGRGKIILLAGGDAKSADFADFGMQVAALHCDLVLIGRDAKTIASSLQKGTAFYFSSDLQQAVLRASEIAESGDTVLLAPACASFDMFENYQQRGDVFKDAVNKLSLTLQQRGEC